MIINKIKILVLALFFIINFYDSAFCAVNARAEKRMMEILSNGRCTGYLLENYFPSVVFFQVETGGLSRVDPVKFSSRGISWKEQNYKINGVDISDPFASGYPLFEPSWETIESVEVWSVRENDPYKTGLNWNVPLPETHGRHVLSYNGIFPEGNRRLIPEGKLDREPSFHYGSPAERRRYLFSREGNAAHITENYFLAVEILNTRRAFPTLVGDDGGLVRENAGKYTFTSAYRNTGSVSYGLLGIVQYNENDNYGANLRLCEKETMTQKNAAGHLQFCVSKKINRGEISLLSGITARLEELVPRSDTPSVQDLSAEDQAALHAGNINRINFDNSFTCKYKYINMKLSFQSCAISFRPDIPYSQTMLYQEDSGIYAVTLWDETDTSREFLHTGMLMTGTDKKWGMLKVSGNVFVDKASARSNGGELLSWYGIGGKLLSELEFSATGTSLFGCVLHQPAKMTSDIVSFLDTSRPSGSVYTGWIDVNSNGIAESFELSQATLVSTTGGKYHHSHDLKRPYHQEISLGIEQSVSKNINVRLEGSHRIFRDYFIVNYGSYDGVYTEIDGISIYNKPADADEYYLTNYNGSDSYYSGAEIMTSFDYQRLFLSIWFTAFMVTGCAPIGNSADFNDYAVIIEESASPNSRINSVGGRFASDRAYMGKLIFAYLFSSDLSLGMIVKYRDGEPFSQYRIYYDANGMPVRVMDQVRGDWFGQGTGRYTFSWNWDIKLRYCPRQIYENLTIILDIYNVLGSATEIKESNNPDDKRLALEAVPGRMFKLGAKMKI